MEQILKVVVGSQAHGLAGPNSDFDYRGVFITPTSKIVSLKGTPDQTSWIEGKEDDTSWEIGKFLFLALKCNPTILEVFLSPRVDIKKCDRVGGCQKKLYREGDMFGQEPECKCDSVLDYGDQLRALFPYIWDTKKVCDAFIGYSFNQRKKFIEDKDKRGNKYAAAYLRTLYQAYELITTGTFTIRIVDTPIGEACGRFKRGEYEFGEVMQLCHDWEVKLREAEQNAEPHFQDLDKVDEFLLKVRKENW